MEKAKMNNKKKILLLAAVLVLVGIIAGAVAIKKQIDKKTDDASWAEYYMEQCAPYTLAYDELPGDIESWRAWQPGGFGIDKLTDDDNDRIGKNDLGTLSYAYEKLVEIRLVEPENDQCRELFETLTPYFEKAFHWEEGTTPEECLKRLQEFSEEEAMEEIEELVGPVWNLYEALQVEEKMVLATGGNLEMLPDEYYTASSGDLQSVPDYPIASSGNLQTEP